MDNPIVINVSKDKLLTESSIASFAAQIKNILRNVLSLEAYRAIIREEEEETKFVVGRNKDENEMIKAIALPDDILLEAKDFVGPVSILRGTDLKKHLKFAASVTLRYSDAPNDKTAIVSIKNNDSNEEN